MNIDLVNGTYSPSEAMELVSRLVEAKIGFLRDRIEATTNEEDIKMRERRIRLIQEELHRTRAILLGVSESCDVVTSIGLEHR